MEHPIIFIHGFPFNKNMWLKQLEALPEDQTGIAIDVRGHGNSTMGHGFFSIDLFARDLLEFMRKKEIKKAVLCGVSMGGYIALRAHELDPDKFSALILSDTNSISDNNEAKVKRFETIKSVLKHGNRTFALNFVKKVFSEHSIQNNPDDVEMIKSSIRRNNVRSICATLLALASRTDTTEHLKNIQIPTLLIWGAEDQVTPKSQADILMEHIPGAQMVTFEKCGHLPSLEDSDRFNQVIASFIAALDH
ncbi:MAG TPA: alpha/beta fold hydrolase [Sphingobacteriaceae bacterium]|nr:alpha/beta fold hydrolase [Sphingobacteriaceae bacterium]